MKCKNLNALVILSLLARATVYAVIDPTMGLTPSPSITPSLSPSPSPTPIRYASVSCTQSNESEEAESLADFTVSLSSSAPTTISVPISFSGSASRFDHNIISNSSIETNLAGWYSYSTGGSDLVYSRTESESFFGHSSVKAVATSVGSNSILAYNLAEDIQSLGGLDVGKDYTFSFYARSAASTSIVMDISNWPSGGSMANFGFVTLTDQWKRYSFSFRPNFTGMSPNYSSIHFYLFGSNMPAELYFDGLRLELSSQFGKYGDYELFGQNLVSNSDLELNLANWSMQKGGGDGTITRSTDFAYSGTHSVKFSASTFSGWLIPSYSLYNDVPTGLTVGAQYVLSYRSRSSSFLSLDNHIANSNNTSYLAPAFGKADYDFSWRRFEFVFVPRIPGAPPDAPLIRVWANASDVPLTAYYDDLQLQSTTLPTSVTFSPGETTKHVQANIINDNIFEGSGGETIVISLSSPSGSATLGTPSTAVYTIFEDPTDIPRIAVRNMGRTIFEAAEDTPTGVDLVPDKVREVNITVPLIASGTATAGIDYTSFPSVVTILPQEYSTQVEVAPINDDLDEYEETMTVSVGTTSSSASPDDSDIASRTLTILDDGDPKPFLSLSANSYSVAEGTRNVQVCAELSIPSGRTVTADVVTSSGTALLNDDFFQPAEKIVIEPGSMSGCLSIPIVADCKSEQAEDFTAHIVDVSEGLMATPNVATIVIDPSIVTLELVPNGTTSPRVIVYTSHPDCVAMWIQMQYSKDNGDWTDCALTDFPNPWYTSTGCGVEVTSWDTSFLEDEDDVALRLLVTPDAESEAIYPGMCGRDGSTRARNLRRAETPNASTGICYVQSAPTTMTPTPTPALSSEAVLSQDVFNSKYLSLGSAYQLTLENLESLAGKSVPAMFSAADSTHASVLTTQATYSQSNALNSNVRYLGAFMSAVWNFSDTGAGVSRTAGSDDTWDRVSVKYPFAGKYLLPSQNLATILRGGSFYDTIRVVARHSTAFSALPASPAEVSEYIHTIQGTESLVYATKKSTVSDPRSYPIDPVSLPDFMQGYFFTAHNAAFNLDNKRSSTPEKNAGQVETPVPETIFPATYDSRDGGYTMRAAVYENTISSNGGPNASYNVSDATGVDLVNTFGHVEYVATPQGVAGPAINRGLWAAQRASIPDHNVPITAANGLLIREQTGPVSKAQRDGKLVYEKIDAPGSGSLFIPESVATIDAAGSVVLGDGKSDPEKFSSDLVTFNWLVSLFPRDLPPETTSNLSRADRVGQVYYTESEQSLCVSVALPGINGVNGDRNDEASAYGWRRLRFESPTPTVSPSLTPWPPYPTGSATPLPTLTPSPTTTTLTPSPTPSPSPSPSPSPYNSRISVSKLDMQQLGSPINISGSTATVHLRIRTDWTLSQSSSIYWRALPFGKSRTGETLWQQKTISLPTATFATNWYSDFDLGLPLAAGNGTLDGTSLSAGQIVELVYIAKENSDTPIPVPLSLSIRMPYQ